MYMPELPEVETVRRDLSQAIPGRKIVKLEIFDQKLTKHVPQIQEITGKTFAEPDRKGKFLILPLRDYGKIPVIHLRMTGQIIFRSAKNKFAAGHPGAFRFDNLPDKFTRLLIRFDNDGELFFNDARRFGTLELLSADEMEGRFAPFGIEPGTKQWNFCDFAQLFAERKTSVKALLLNQNRIFGLGNIYADESCFHAGILPFRPADSLSKAELKKIFLSCTEIIATAIASRGTSVRDYTDAQGQQGGYAEKLMVYGRAGLPCLVCGTKISKIKHAGRGTHFCENCQK